ncbi:iron chaperone [Blastococcus sp. SYSU D00669]
MTGRDASVDEYVAALPEDVRPVLEGLRDAVHAAVPGAGETISYKMPTFTLDGRPLLHLAAWKRHIGLYPFPELDGELGAALEPYRGTDKGTMRLPLARPIPYELVGRMAAALARQRD